MKILNLIENTEGAEGCAAEHGLSFYIETEKHRLLMDLGPSASVIGNAEKLGVDLKMVDTVILSHGHDDHGGDTNGDGDKSLPNPGSWSSVYNNAGTVKLAFAKVFYGGNQGGDASIRNVNGITELNCCEIKHAEMSILNADNGTIRAENCVIQDGRWGAQGRVSLLNCVVADCMTGVVSGSAINTVFYNCTTPVSGTQVRCSMAFGTSSTQSAGGGDMV